MSKSTKAEIVDSFIRFLNQKPIRRITVKNIVGDCNINRNTFYYYFDDVYAVLDEVLEVKHQKECEKSHNYEELYAIFWRGVRFAQNNKKAVRNMYQYMGRDQFDNYFYSGMDTAVTSFVRQQAKGIVVSEENIHLVSRFCRYVILGLMVEWMKSGMDDDLEFFLNSMINLAKEKVRFLLLERGKS